MHIQYQGMRCKYVLLLAVLALCTGCVAYRVPTVPPPSSSILSHTRQLTLGVKRSQRSTSRQYQYAESFGSEQELIEALRARGTFKQVDFVDRLPSAPDLVLRDTFFGKFHHFCEPMELVIFAGIVPHVCGNRYLLEFELTDRTGSIVRSVNAQEEDPRVIGWVALPMKLSPHWSGKEMDHKVVMGRFAIEVEKAVWKYNEKRRNE